MERKEMKILLVEDDEIARENAVEYLNTLFNTVFEAKDGLEALKLYNQEHPDIIISDIQMPKFNGLEFIEQIRKKDRTTQIIITSAFSTKEYLLRAVELQLVKYLIKPVSEEALNDAIQHCFENRLSQQSNIVPLKEGYTFDTYNQTLFCHQEQIKLRTKEILLLDLLLKNAQRFVTYSEIEQVVWQEESMSKDALKTLIRDIKAKLPKESIVNLSGTGYKINV
ncbi:response regulator transcription factor [Candidatus Marinarcus aquaticus]|uniref:DNA-binding response regulator n=1 Tax=Candidatus Marinarcus aquaticus TaxID=2044504 RepID=A0A4V1LP25_9BACT|nr:response regulator [Candidatus Marinarcus aquaticus]RXJ58040.1 DNA-binding response regulator [Candidatus Marinarcus aquaticus]